MKKFLLALIMTTMAFMSCKFDANQDNGNRATIRINVSTTDDSDARTAIPTIEWSDFTYNLTAVKNPDAPDQGDPINLFQDREYGSLVKGFEMDIGRYRFVLDAYKNGQKSLSGETVVDLSTGDASLSFWMMPVSGSTGSAWVKVYFPMDNTVAKVESAISSDIFISPTSVETKELPVSIVSGQNMIKMEGTNLPSRSELYALFWMYDASGALVYSGAESLIIVGGCVSTSEITLTKNDWHTYLSTITLNKDGSGWISSGRTVTLVDTLDSSQVYGLKDSSQGKFIASVADGTYEIFVDGEGTGLLFNSVDKAGSVDYYTISHAQSGQCAMNPVSGGIVMEKDGAIVQGGKNFEYKIDLSLGYEIDGNNFVVSVNSQPVPGAKPGVVLTIPSVDSAKTVEVNGIKIITYTITYADENGNPIGSSKDSGFDCWWFGDGFVAPTTFDAGTSIDLPTMTNVRRNGGFFFDAWIENGGASVRNTQGIYRNLILNASWKEAPYVDTINKVIYANGFNLLVTGDTAKTNDKTFVYIDYNGDGVKNGDDWQLDCDLGTDFTNYEIRAGNKDGKEINSDFTITMTGGIISSIYGLDSKTVKRANKSIINIKGTAVIGDVEEAYEITNADTTKTMVAKKAKGVMLETFTNERVNVIDQMGYSENGAIKRNYSITCITPYYYEAGIDRYVACIQNSNFASFTKFACWTYDADKDDGISGDAPYTKAVLAQKNVNENGVTRIFARLADGSGIVLPKEAPWTDFGEFTIGSDSIALNCSVFSIAVENGTFRVNRRTTITDNSSDNDKAVESTLTYMAQPTPLTYVEKFEFNENYVYMQVMSVGNLLTPQIASEFMEQLYFKKIDDSKPIKVTVNLETVPSNLIQGKGDIKGGSEYKYFNGSFYTRVEAPYVESVKKKTMSWTAAYNEAKKKEFNGMQGYLMNITSEVENNYIFDTYYKLYPDQLSFGGGSLYDSELSGNFVYDCEEMTTGSKKSGTKWRWMAGPEAGMIFFNTAVADDEKNAAAGPVEGVFNKWNNSKYLYKDEWTEDINDLSYPLRGRVSSEPNSKSGTTSSEPAMQFLAGKLASSYFANGYWNNISDSVISSQYASSGYIVEFTPYKTQYGEQVASNISIKKSASY